MMSTRLLQFYNAYYINERANYIIVMVLKYNIWTVCKVHVLITIRYLHAIWTNRLADDDHLNEYNDCCIFRYLRNFYFINSLNSLLVNFEWRSSRPYQTWHLNLLNKRVFAVPSLFLSSIYYVVRIKYNVIIDEESQFKNYFSLLHFRIIRYFIYIILVLQSSRKTAGNSIFYCNYM